MSKLENTSNTVSSDLYWMPLAARAAVSGRTVPRPVTPPAVSRAPPAQLSRCVMPRLASSGADSAAALLPIQTPGYTWQRVHCTTHNTHINSTRASNEGSQRFQNHK